MPPKKKSVSAITALRQGRLNRLQAELQEKYDEATHFLDTVTGDLSAASDQDDVLEKLSEFIFCFQSDLPAYDEACDSLLEGIDSEGLKSFDESCVGQYLDFRSSFKSILRKLQLCQHQLDKIRQTSTDSSRKVKSEPVTDLTSAFEKQMKHLFALNEETRRQTQDLLKSQNQLVQQQIRSASTPASTSVKLPSLEIPKYSGDVLQWTEFHDLFMSAVHSHKQLSDVQKLTYLKDHLTDAALDAISGIQISDASYSEAIDILKSRFGDPQAIVDAHHIALMELPVASAKTSSLRQLYDALEMHLRSLSAMGHSTDQPIFVSMITSKLPRKIMVQLELHKGTGSWTVPKLRSALQQFVSAQEAADRQCFSVSKAKSSQSTSQPASSSSAPVVASGQALATSSSVNPKCAFCRGNHYSDECKVHTTIEARKTQAKDRCFKCFRSGHAARTCTAAKRCYHCGERNHHRSLCPTKFGHHKSTQSSLNAAVPAFQPHQATSTLVGEDQEVIMQTALTQISTDSSCSAPARILFDTGSSRSFVTECLQKSAKFEVIGSETIALGTFGDQKRRNVTYTKVRVPLCTSSSSHEISACVVPNITSPISKVPLDVTRHPSLKAMKLAEPLDSSDDRLNIDILVGLDHYYELIGSDRLTLDDGLVLLESPFGLVTAGKVDVPDRSKKQVAQDVHSCLITSHMLEWDSEFDLQRFWALEEMCSDELSSDDAAYQKFLDTVHLEHGRYVVSWPWKEVHADLPNNYGLALGRLKSLWNRLRDQLDVLHQYDSIIHDQLAQGIIEPVEHGMQQGKLTHYLPHHCVVKPSHTTTKIRIVYDASAKASPTVPSLNDCLYAGPSLVPDLCGILLRFRLSPVAIISDIEKAFLQISLSEPDRDVTRFLWLRDPSLPVEPDNLRVFRFCRVPFGVVSSPFLLAATISHHLKTCSIPEASQILANTYVDNVIGGAMSDEDALQYYRSAKAVFAAASMNLREWSTNSPAVMKQLPSQDCANGTVQKCLGLVWDTVSDTLGYLPVPATQPARTKRQILQRISRFFDPLGLQSPVLIQAKVFMQTLWKLEVGWDDPLPDEITKQWSLVSQDITEASLQTYSRFLGPLSSGSVELHVFCDASQLAYAAVAYLRVLDQLQPVANIIFSKSRVAPVKQVSIPRLELLAAVLGAKVVRFLCQHLPYVFTSVVLWSDSTTVLHWLSSDENLPTFVRNRVAVIKSVPQVEFRYVKSSFNPADLPSRGVTSSSLSSNELWWHGPSFLSSACAITVAVVPGEGLTDSSHSLEGSKEQCPKHSQTKKITDALSGESSPPFGIDASKFSSFEALVRVSALCVRFLCRVRRAESARGPVTVSELRKSRLTWLQHAQKSDYHDVIKAIKEHRPHPLVTKLNLFLDQDGLIRCGGRLDNADLRYESKYPVLVPRDHPIARLLILDSHREVLHAGVKHTLSWLRLRYWIPKGRACVKLHIGKCQLCRLHHGGPYTVPQMAPLPTMRATSVAPFSHVGIDYFGPVYVKHQSTDQKAWVCLFVCMSTRAVHMELVNDMTAEEFLLALRRFVARRGTPSVIVSDNAAQFKTGKSVLDLAWIHLTTDDGVISYASRNNVEWKFIVPQSPWMGGSYERIVGVVKRSLRKAVGKRLYTFNQLSTILNEVEAIVNSRPIVYVDDDIDDVLTPSHFLCLRNSCGFLPALLPSEADDPDYVPTDNLASKLLETWKKGQRNLDQFWTSWRNDYLLNLRESQTSQHKQPRVNNCSPKIGDVVLVKDDLPRGFWRLGRLTSVQKSADGLVRSATVTTADKKELKRPISLLYPIEFSQDLPKPDLKSSKPDLKPTKPDCNDHQRPQRKAAQKCLRMVQGLADEGSV